MKNTNLSLLLVFLVSACSHKTESTATAGLPGFSVNAGDVISTSVETATLHTYKLETQAMYVVHVDLSDAKGAEFRKFTKDHSGQRFQILVGTNIVQNPLIQRLVGTNVSEQPVIMGDVVSSKIVFSCSTPAEAQSIADLFSKK